MKRLRIICAIGKKDITQMMRYPTWFIQLIIWPLIFPLIYILGAMGMAGPGQAGMSSFKSVAGTDSVMGFIVVGTMVWMWINMTMWGFGTYLREEQTRGTLESNWLCPIKKFDILLGGSMVSLFEALFINIISIVEYRYIYRIHFTGNILEWCLIFIIMIPGVYGLGALFASLILWAKDANAAVNVVRGSVMILCGITFPITIMPQWMQVMAKCLPFTHGIEAARKIMINGQSIFVAGQNIGICVLEGLILVFIGRIVFMKTEQKVRNSGSLERF